MRPIGLLLAAQLLYGQQTAAQSVNIAPGSLTSQALYFAITEDQKTAQLSLGILGTQERAHLAGGRVDVVGGPGHGTLVAVWIPLSGATHTNKPRLKI